MCSLTRVLERFLVLKPIFLARLSVWHGQGTKLGSQKIVAASEIVSTMQAGLYFRSSICHSLFNLTPGEHLHPAKLRSTSSSTCLSANSWALMKVLSNFLWPTSFPAWSSTNSRQSMLKALLNDRFLPIPLDEKKKGDGCSLGRNRGAQVVGASSEDALLRIPLYWLSLCFPRTGVCICGSEHVGNGGGDDPSSITGTLDTDGGADNPSIGTDTPDIDDTNRGADDPGTGTDIPDADGRADHRRADKLGTDTDIPDADGRADNPGTDTADLNTDTDANADANGGADLGTNIADADADKRVAASDKPRVSLFSLRKALFFLFSSSELETVSASPPSSIIFLSPVTMVKQNAPSSRYPVAEMCMSSLNKASSSISSALTPSRFLAKYSQSWVVFARLLVFALLLDFA